MGRVKTGGGWRAVLYTLKKAREAGGLWPLWRAMRTKNACKTCAVGMGGQSGGMVNEAGHFPEVCKKSFQAMVADMQGAVKSSFFATYSVPQLRLFTPYQLEHSGRLVEPVVLEKGSQHYRPIAWADAMERIAAKLRGSLPAETFFYFSGRSSNEAGFLLQLFARLYGTNHVNNCSFYCHQASGVGLTSVIGTGAGTVTLDDMERADLVLLLGGNPASNHPRLMRTLMMVRRRGGKVISINPIIETGTVNFSVPSDPWALFFGAEIASTHVQPHVGGDLALLYGLMKRLLELHRASPRPADPIVDEAFLNGHTTGWQELAARLENLPWDEIVAKSGVPKPQIDDIAAHYAASQRAIFAWTMGVTHQLHGAATVQAIAQLALMRRMVGKPGAGLQPIRGHSNIQGMGTVGVTPTLKKAIFDRLESHFGVTLPTTKGFDTLECLDAAHAGAMRFALCLGGNLYGASPESGYAGRALERIDTLVYLSTSLNTGHAWGTGAEETIILPVLARDEEPEPSTQESMFSYIRLSDGGRPRHAVTETTGPRSEVSIIADLALRVLGDAASAGGGCPVNWREMAHTSTIRQAIGKIVPGLEEIASIDRTRKEFSIPGRTLDTPEFPTADGRAHLFVHDLPPAPEGMQLMTIRSEGQFNTVVYEENDLYRNQTRRDIVLIHPDDIRRLGLTAGATCRIVSGVGEMRGQIVSPFDQIRPGNVAMYYPESNILVPKAADPLSRTPAYKRVAVTVTADVAGGTVATPVPEMVGVGTRRDTMNACAG